jgi:hypothetical protein
MQFLFYFKIKNTVPMSLLCLKILKVISYEKKSSTQSKKKP